jgi:hypothetical protein
MAVVGGALKKIKGWTEMQKEAYSMIQYTVFHHLTFITGGYGLTESPLIL